MALLELSKDMRLDKILSHMEKNRYKTVYLIISDDDSVAAKYCRSIDQPYVFNVPSEIIDKLEDTCNQLTSYKTMYYRTGNRRPYVLKFWRIDAFEPKSIDDYIWQLTIVKK